MRRSENLIYAAAFIALILAPFYLGGYELSLLGRFLAMGILAMGISLVWGNAGILPLGQGLFFGLGGYALAMHLKLTALGPGEIPDFMQWNGLNSLPWLWVPFKSGIFALFAAVAFPAIVAAALAWLVFHRRVGGVYFAIITQALVLAATTFIVSQQGYTGGFNGLTDFGSAFGFDLSDPHTQLGLYWLTLAILGLIFIAGQWLLQTHFGKLLRAIRDGENRVRFLGYDSAPYKVIVFALGAVLAGIAGVLYTLNISVISPAMIGVMPSIEMVVWVAVGGRESLAGAVLGTLLVNFAKDKVSSAFPEAWLYLMGALFVFVVTLMPQGIGGLLDSLFNRGKGEARETVVIPPVLVVSGDLPEEIVSSHQKEEAHS
ncbi:MAG TPA: urea ABC transporter permease subunit UrtC [Candidatus Binataceae bacterium]|nr:urea ABC transporter permease subunit UrtC [Candidatus Binataceae bacterium]